MLGKRDPASGLTPERAREDHGRIAGVQIRHLSEVVTRSGSLFEVFRDGWVEQDVIVRQVNYTCLRHDGVTDWHCHAVQNDRLVAVAGAIKLVLWDGRNSSATYGESDVIHFGALQPLIVTVPFGVWHALRNEGGEPAVYLNVADQSYDHAEPDNWRAPRDLFPDL
jgi:dTDP-4-dehydrorhamnose 3,5-epimerase